MSDVAVVVPAFRAARTIGSVVERIHRISPGATVLVVDDGSDDDTAARAAAAGAAVASHRQNQGKGRALATGLSAALALDGVRFLVTLDADGQHPPEAMPALLAPLIVGQADLVVGARPRDPELMPLPRRCSNWLSSALVSRAVGAHVPDSQSGYRAMTAAVAETVRPAGSRYEYETEFLLEAAERGYRIGAVAIPAVYEGEESHFRYFGDTARLAAVFLKHWRLILRGPDPV